MNTRERINQLHRLPEQRSWKSPKELEAYNDRSSEEYKLNQIMERCDYDSKYILSHTLLKLVDEFSPSTLENYIEHNHGTKQAGLASSALVKSWDSEVTKRSDVDLDALAATEHQRLSPFRELARVSEIAGNEPYGFMGIMAPVAFGYRMKQGMHARIQGDAIGNGGDALEKAIVERDAIGNHGNALNHNVVIERDAIGNHGKSVSNKVTVKGMADRNFGSSLNHDVVVHGHTTMNYGRALNHNITVKGNVEGNFGNSLNYTITVEGDAKYNRGKSLNHEIIIERDAKDNSEYSLNHNVVVKGSAYDSKGHTLSNDIIIHQDAVRSTEKSLNNNIVIRRNAEHNEDKSLCNNVKIGGNANGNGGYTLHNAVTIEGNADNNYEFALQNHVVIKGNATYGSGKAGAGATVQVYGRSIKNRPESFKGAQVGHRTFFQWLFREHIPLRKEK